MRVVADAERARRRCCDRADAIVARDPDVLTELVAACAAIKADVVAARSRRSAPACARRSTSATRSRTRSRPSGGYELPHGEAVAIGPRLRGRARGRARAGRRPTPSTATGDVVGVARPPDRGARTAARRRRAARGDAPRQEGERRAHVRARRARRLETVDDPPRPRSPSRSARSASVDRSWEADEEPWPRSCCSPGPNLNLLGDREPEIYGTDTLDDCVGDAPRPRPTHGHELEHLQSNHEGELVDAIHGARGRCAAIVINPGAFTHYVVRDRRRARRVRRREGRAAPLEPVGARGVAAHVGGRAVRHRHGRRVRPRRVPPRGRGRGRRSCWRPR